MADTHRIAIIGKAARQWLGETKSPLGHGQQHGAAVRYEAAAVKSSCDFFAGAGRKRKRPKIISAVAGVAGVK